MSSDRVSTSNASTSLRDRAMRVGEVLLAGPTLGALWVVLLTTRAFAGDDDKYLGVRATPIIELAKTHFADDVRGLTWALAATAIGLGAAIGVGAELLVALRRSLRGGLATPGRRLLARAVLVILLHAVVFAWGVARMPQLYTDTLYSRPGSSGLARTTQILITDVLGTSGIIAFASIAALAWVAPAAAHVDRLIAFVRAKGRALLVPAGVSLFCLVVIVLGFRIASAPHKTKRHGGAPNVVVIAVDSLRDDRLTPRTTPRLSALASEGTRFSRAYVTLPRTLPSWTTILTGREPHRHGLRTMFPRYEDRARDLGALPARLGALGYRSAVVGDYAADIFTRVRYGFDVVEAPTFNFHALIATRALEKATPLLPLLHGGLGRRLLPAMREMNQAADPMLVAKDARRALDRVGGGDSPFFLTVFFSTAHFPYAAPAPYYSRFTDPSYRGRFKYHKPNVLGQEGALDQADIRQVRALYDGAVLSVDDAAGTILDELTARGLDEDTIVIVTADHGEMLFDDGHGQGHGDHLFGDQVVHVPLAMKIPARITKSKGNVVDAIVRDIDLAPTILELAGGKKPEGAAPVPGELDGRSLRALLEGGTLPPLPAFAETEIWMTETIPELPSSGPSPLRLPYPNVAQLTELDPRLAYDVVMRAEAEPIVIASKHRSVIDGSMKLVYVPTRKGARYFLYDRQSDPAESLDLSAKRPDDFGRLRGLLWRWMLGDPRMEERDGMLVPRPLESFASTLGPAGLRVK